MPERGLRYAKDYAVHHVRLWDGIDYHKDPGPCQCVQPSEPPDPQTRSSNSLLYEHCGQEYRSQANGHQDHADGKAYV